MIVFFQTILQMLLYLPELVHKIFEWAQKMIFTILFIIYFTILFTYHLFTSFLFHINCHNSLTNYGTKYKQQEHTCAQSNPVKCNDIKQTKCTYIQICLISRQNFFIFQMQFDADADKKKSINKWTHLEDCAALVEVGFTLSLLSTLLVNQWVQLNYLLLKSSPLLPQCPLFHGLHQHH